MNVIPIWRAKKRWGKIRFLLTHVTPFFLNWTFFLETWSCCRSLNPNTKDSGDNWRFRYCTHNEWFHSSSKRWNAFSSGRSWRRILFISRIDWPESVIPDVLPSMNMRWVSHWRQAQLRMLLSGKRERLREHAQRSQSNWSVEIAILIVQLFLIATMYWEQCNAFVVNIWRTY